MHRIRIQHVLEQLIQFRLRGDILRLQRFVCREAAGDAGQPATGAHVQQQQAAGLQAEID